EFRPTIADAIPGIVALLKDSDEFVRSSTGSALAEVSKQGEFLPLVRVSILAAIGLSDKTRPTLPNTQIIPHFFGLSTHPPSSIVDLLQGTYNITRSEDIKIIQCLTMTSRNFDLPLSRLDLTVQKGKLAIGKVVTALNIRIWTRPLPVPFRTLVALLKDSDSSVRSSTVSPWPRFQSKTNFEPPLRLPFPALLKDSDHYVQLRDTIGPGKFFRASRISTHHWRMPFLALLHSTFSAQAKFRAAITPAIPDIIALLKDPDWFVKSNAVSGPAGGFREKCAEFRAAIVPAIPDIVALLKDSDNHVRSITAHTLARFSEQGVPNFDPPSRMPFPAEFRAVIALQFPTLLHCYRTPDEVVRSRGVSELAKFSEQAEFRPVIAPAIPDIVALLKDPHRFVRSSGYCTGEGFRARPTAELRPAIACLIPAIVALLEDAHFQTQTNVLDLLVQLAAHDCLREAILGCKLERHFISLVNNDEDEVVSNVGKLFVAFAERGKL
ncbi:armadillo-type protein, partial [Hysterangium stoloniferum]